MIVKYSSVETNDRRAPGIVTGGQLTVPKSNIQKRLEAWHRSRFEPIPYHGDPPMTVEQMRRPIRELFGLDLEPHTGWQRWKRTPVPAVVFVMLVALIQTAL